MLIVQVMREEGVVGVAFRRRVSVDQLLMLSSLNKDCAPLGNAK